MKKLIALALVLTMVLCLAAGCSKAGNTTPNAPTESATTEKPTDSATNVATESVILGNKNVETPGAFDVEEVTPNRAYKIVVTQMNTNDTNAVTAIDGFKKAGEYYGVEIIAMDNKGDPIQAVTNLDTAITMEADYFISYTADAGACAQIAAKLTEEGMVPEEAQYNYMRSVCMCQSAEREDSNVIEGTSQHQQVRKFI